MKTISVGGKVFTIKKLIPLDFVSLDYIPFSVFQAGKSKKSGGQFNSLMAELETDTEEKQEKKALKQYRQIIESGCCNKDFNFETTLNDIGFTGVEELSGQIIFYSLDLVQDIVTPSNLMLTNCYYLAKTFGGTPWDYLSGSLESFLFNTLSYNAGIMEENRTNG